MSSISSYDEHDYEPDLDKRSKSTSAITNARRSTVYDAVAGRLTNDRFIRSKDFIPATRDTTSSSHVTLPPGEALFRSSNAPIHYTESGVYDQDHRLTSNEPLPDSDLLKAVHSYSSDFYARTAGEQADLDYQSLDGSALLALGILLEESCNAILGDTGDLVLLEERSPSNVHVNVSQEQEDGETKGDEGEPSPKRRRV